MHTADLVVTLILVGALWLLVARWLMTSTRGAGNATSRAAAPIRSESDTMMPSGPRTYAIRQTPSYSPMPPSSP